MKKIKFYFVALALTGSFVFYNCSNDDKVDSSVENADTKNSNSSLIASRGSELIIIPSDEAPEYDSDLLEALGFTSFILDTDRDCILDTENNVVSLPYDDQSVMHTANKEIKFDISIKIAKMNDNDGPGGCSSCVDCTGFRCRGRIKLLGITIAEWGNKKAAGTLSNDRNQEGYVELDETNKTINMYFYNDVEWNNLQN